MKITYIHHSCFSFELNNAILLFDYFQGNLPHFDKDKTLYVFSSHSHYDHFNESIFDLEKIHPNVKYILSNDIKTSKSSNTKFIGANETLLLDNLEIKTLESSDLGVAFIVNVENKKIYHAGDLNWWHWEGENTPEQNKDAENKFKSVIYKIKGESFDVAFIPLDPRQENQYYLGFDYFMRNTNTKFAFPMHFGGNFAICEKFKNLEYASDYKDKIMIINKENQTFEL